MLEPQQRTNQRFLHGLSIDGGTGVGLDLVKKMSKVYGWTILEKSRTGRALNL